MKRLKQTPGSAMINFKNSTLKHNVYTHVRNLFVGYDLLKLAL